MAGRPKPFRHQRFPALEGACMEPLGAIGSQRHLKKTRGPRWHGDPAVFAGLLWREEARPSARCLAGRRGLGSAEAMAYDRKQIEQLARTYTDPWCSRDPARVAALRV